MANKLRGYQAAGMNSNQLSLPKNATRFKVQRYLHCLLVAPRKK